MCSHWHTRVSRGTFLCLSAWLLSVPLLRSADTERQYAAPEPLQPRLTVMDASAASHPSDARQVSHPRNAHAAEALGSSIRPIGASSDGMPDDIIRYDTAATAVLPSGPG
jgi:hypothetical protein